MPANYDFLNQPAPQNYVAGLGRGATGFTTRSDLGPAREGPSEEAMKEALAKRAAQINAPTPTAYGVTDQDREEAAEAEGDRFADPDNETGLFSHGLFDKEDDEADRIYQAVDDRMGKRRKKAREEREKQEREEYELKNPKISHVFGDLKRALSSVTDEEWANLPEAGDQTGRNKRARHERMQRAYAVPDSVLAAARSANAMDTSIDVANGAQTGSGGATNFGAIGSARTNLLQAKLAQAETEAAATKVANGSATGVDKDAMMTALGMEEAKAGMLNIYDIKRTRPLLESVTKANPKHAPGWISLARLEEHAQNIVTARNTIMEGCTACPKNEDVWLEAVRLHKGGDNHNASVIVYQGLQYNNKSWRLWFAATELARDDEQRRRILRKAVDNVPNSIVLWKALINLEDDSNAKGIIQKALDYMPGSIELWVALASLESLEEGRKVINSARRKMPTSHEIWVAAARLEESHGNYSRIPIILNRAVDSLRDVAAQIKREDWLQEAYKAETDGCDHTCKAVVEAMAGWNLSNNDDKKRVWLSEAEAAANLGHYKTARFIYRMVCAGDVADEKAWEAAIAMEEEHGTKEDLYDVLQAATNCMPQVDKFWLQLVNEKWQEDPDAARIVLAAAFKRNQSEALYDMSVDLEIAAKEWEKARGTLRTARKTRPTDRIWVRSVALERNLGHEDEALDLLMEGLDVFPRSGKLWIIKGQMYEVKGMLPQAREAYNTGTRQAPTFVPLWLSACRIELKIGALVKARSILERGRKENPKNELLWLEAVRLELKADYKPAAVNLMAAAQKELPKSGLLWAERIMKLEDRTKRKARALDAMRTLVNDKHIIGAVARLFWGERQIEKANSWFEKAIAADPDWGDSWGWYVRFLQVHGTEEKIASVEERCVEAHPTHGEVWPRYRKDPKNFEKDDREILRMVAKELKEVEAY